MANGMLAYYMCSYFDEETGSWKHILKDDKDIWGGLFEVREIKHIVSHKQQEPVLKGQIDIWQI